MDREQLNGHAFYVLDKMVESKYEKQLDVMYKDSDKGSFASVFGYAEVDTIFIEYLLRHDFTLLAAKPQGCLIYTWEEIKNYSDWGAQYSFLKVIWD